MAIGDAGDTVTWPVLDKKLSWLCCLEIMVQNGWLLITQVRLKATGDLVDTLSQPVLHKVHFMVVPSRNNGTQIKCSSGSSGDNQRL